MSPGPLLYRSGWRHWRRHPWQAVFALLGIAMGVAMVVAVDLASQSARASYLWSTETLAGRATHHVLGVDGGLLDGTYASLRLAGIRDAMGRPVPMTPVLEQRVGVDLPGDTVGEKERDLADPGGMSLRLVGVDPFSSREMNAFGLVEAKVGGAGQGGGLASLLSAPGTVLMSRVAASRLGLREGDALTIHAGARPTRLRILGFLEPRNGLARILVDDILLADLSTAQEALGMIGRISRIEVDLSGSGERAYPDARLKAQVEGRLPPEAFLAASNARARTLDSVSRAFRINLAALSLLALLVGAFLIYNTLSFSVAQRWNLLGTLRGLGATPGDIARLIGREALVLSVAGTALGILGGILLGRGLVSLVARTLNDLYFTATVTGLRIEPWLLAKGAVLGLGVGILASLGPAWQASRIRPRALLTRSAQETRLRSRLPLLNALGLAAAAVSALLALWPAPGASPGEAGLPGLVAGFASLLFAVFAWSLWTPALLRLLCAAGDTALGRLSSVTGAAGTLVRMAWRETGASLSRTGVAAAALMTALSVTVAMGVMVDSFRLAVADWLESILVADVYASAPRRGSGRLQGNLDSAWVESARSLPGVSGTTAYRAAVLNVPGGQVQLLALDMDARTRGAFHFLEGDSAEAWRSFAESPACGLLVSEPFANRHRVGPGGAMELPTRSGTRHFPVAAVFPDYGSDQGVAMLDRACFDLHWSMPGHTSLAFFAVGGIPPDTLARRLSALPGSRAVEIHASGSLREASLRIFDRTFAITSVLRLAAVVVAGIGLVGALAALELERAPETALLRALGLTPFQTWALAAAQSACLGLCTGLLSLPLGLMQSALLIHVINKRSFGWTMPLHADPTYLLQALALGLGAALVAAALPAWKVARAVTARALREE